MTAPRPPGMEGAEFDRFADEYEQHHARNIRLSGESPEFFARYKVEDLARILVPGQPQRILDFGAGVGTSVPHFRALFPAAQLTCLDVSTRSLKIAAQRYPGAASFVPFDGATIPAADGSHDLAFAACVFHHIDASAHVPLLQELRRVLAPGGHLCIFEHNPLNPLTVHAVNTCEFDANAVLIRAGRMRQRLISAGFSDVSVAYRLFFPHALRRLRGLERALTWLPLGAQYRLLARR